MTEQEDLPQLHVNPQYGSIGTLFRFSASDFHPNARIKVSILNPNGQPIYKDNLVTDKWGDISFSKRALDDWPLGGYEFEVTFEVEENEFFSQKPWRRVYAILTRRWRTKETTMKHSFHMA